ncbi:50S ribosomal protein L15 [Candidatus Parcubacteria bacterium]|nr:MAG: 50S ribosomal protein L15 [Candidatus Parcubacteria bacterium]
MQIHQIQPKTKNRKGKYIGRGGKRGTYSGRGIKGQKSRAGRKLRPELRDIIKKLPKQRGYRFKPFQEEATVVNVELLNEKFENGSQINPTVLVGKGLIRTTGGKIPVVKVLGDGDVSKKLEISGCLISASAKEKIEKAGGKINQN